MAVESYWVGTVVRVTATFTAGATPADPTTVVARTRSPGGTVATVAATRTGVGVFTADVALTERGIWGYRFEGTGAVVAAAEGEVNAVSEFV